MPMRNRAIPSIVIGDEAAGHVVIDESGATFYGPDGVTPLFEFDTATGQLTFSSSGSGQRIAMLSNILEFFTDDPGVAGPGLIETLTFGAVGARFGEMFFQSPQAGGRNVATLYLVGDNQTGTTGDRVQMLARDISVQGRGTGLLSGRFSVDNMVDAGIYDANAAGLFRAFAREIGSAVLNGATATTSAANALIPINGDVWLDGQSSGLNRDMSYTFDALNNHHYAVTLIGGLTSSVAGDQGGVAVQHVGGTATGQFIGGWSQAYNVYLPNAGNLYGATAEAHYYCWSDGTCQVRGMLKRLAGTGNVSAVNTALKIIDYGTK